MRVPTLADLGQLFMPDRSFISIARATSAELGPLLGIDEETFRRLRNVVLGSMRDAHVLMPTVRIFDPPMPHPVHDGLILAEFQLATTLYNSAWQGNVLFDCRMVSSSPLGNFDYTTILLAVTILSA